MFTRACFCVVVLATLCAVGEEANGRVEGRYFVGKTAIANQEMILTQQEGSGGVVRAELPRVTTDSEGRFAFDNVQPGLYTVGCFAKYVVRNSSCMTWVASSSHSRWIEVKPGETAKAQVGGVGRKVVGRLVPPKDWTGRIAWQGGDERRISTSSKAWPKPPEAYSQPEKDQWYKEFGKSQESKRLRMARVVVIPVVAADGRFSAEDVPPGDYSLYITIGGDEAASLDGRPFGEANLEFSVPDGDDSAPVDLGEIRVVLYGAQNGAKAAK